MSVYGDPTQQYLENADITGNHSPVENGNIVETYRVTSETDEVFFIQHSPYYGNEIETGHAALETLENTDIPVQK